MHEVYITVARQRGGPHVRMELGEKNCGTLFSKLSKMVLELTKYQFVSHVKSYIQFTYISKISFNNSIKF